MDTENIVPLLLGWFRRIARQLPWRNTRDPYAIWVSEVMLQQTQVKTVIPYWERWMRALPTIEALARAEPETIHKLWEGLGYYTRVRNMHRAAQVIMETHRGNFPRKFADVLNLPGIGRYTAGAICSIAYDQPHPILDGNVIRVLTRLEGIGGNPREASVNAALWALAEQLVLAAAQHRPAHAKRARNRPCSHLNQALMELGALVCTPKQPRCGVCPLNTRCRAYREGCTETLPNLRRRPAAIDRRFLAFVVRRQGRLLIRRRPPGVVNAHLWELPNIEVGAGGEDIRKAARRVLGFTPVALTPLGAIKHSITRYRFHVEAYVAALPPRLAMPSKVGRWATDAETHRLPFSSAHRKLVELAQAGTVTAGK
jgi:A/G-specific adenine glycosylase